MRRTPVVVSFGAVMLIAVIVPAAVATAQGRDPFRPPSGPGGQPVTPPVDGSEPPSAPPGAGPANGLANTGQDLATPFAVGALLVLLGCACLAAGRVLETIPGHG